MRLQCASCSSLSSLQAPSMWLQHLSTPPTAHLALKLELENRATLSQCQAVYTTNVYAKHARGKDCKRHPFALVNHYC